MYLIYNHKTRQGRILDDNKNPVLELPPHRADNPAPRFALQDPFNYTEQFLSYLASLYLDGVLVETDTGDGCVWAMIRVFDENDTESLENNYTYRGEIGFLIDQGVIHSEVLVTPVEEII